jgi:hypothetical protein
MTKHRTKAPEYLCENESPRGNRTEKIPKGSLPQVWEPKALSNADGRWTVIKVLKEKIERLKNDVGCDSFQKEMLCERAGFLTAILETMETNAIEKGQLDAGCYTQSLNALVGILRQLGMKKITKKCSLNEYVKTKATQ